MEGGDGNGGGGGCFFASGRQRVSNRRIRGSGASLNLKHAEPPPLTHGTTTALTPSTLVFFTNVAPLNETNSWLFGISRTSPRTTRSCACPKNATGGRDSNPLPRGTYVGPNMGTSKWCASEPNGSEAVYIMVRTRPLSGITVSSETFTCTPDTSARTLFWFPSPSSTRPQRTGGTDTTGRVVPSTCTCTSDIVRMSMCVARGLFDTHTVVRGKAKDHVAVTSFCRRTGNVIRGGTTCTRVVVEEVAGAADAVVGERGGLDDGVSGAVGASMLLGDDGEDCCDSVATVCMPERVRSRAPRSACIFKKPRSNCRSVPASGDSVISAMGGAVLSRPHPRSTVASEHVSSHSVAGLRGTTMCVAAAPLSTATADMFSMAKWSGYMSLVNSRDTSSRRACTRSGFAGSSAACAPLLAGTTTVAATPDDCRSDTREFDDSCRTAPFGIFGLNGL
eukprot:PhM_4_TR18624/c2_g1_i1/m.27231